MAKPVSDDYRDRAKRSQKEKQERGKFQFAEGDNVIRILPTPADPDRNSPEVFIEYCMHNNVGPNKRYVRCGKDLRGRGKCWLCDVVIPKLRSVGKNKLAQEMASKPIFEVQVAAVDADSGEWRGPLRLYKGAGSSAKSLAYKLQGLIASTKKDYVDPRNGYNIQIQRSGTTLTDTVYDVMGAEDEPSRVPKDIVASLKPFVDVIPGYDAESQKAAYYGREDEEPEPVPTQRRGRPAPVEEEEEAYEEEAPPPSKRKRPVPEVEEPEEDFEAEEEEAPPAPKRKHPKPPPDEEPEDEFGDGYEDDLPPVPKKKPAKPVVEEEEEEDDYDVPPPTPKRKRPAVEEPEEDFEAEEEAPPVPKRKVRR